MSRSVPSAVGTEPELSVRPLELRVHGVGNPPDSDILPPPDGPEPPTEVRVVRWGDLISGNWWLPFWIVLAPFTLANVAGWMHPANAPRRAAWCRRVAHLVGISLTITTTAWVTHLIVELVAWQGLVGLDIWVYHPLRRLWLGVAITLLGILGAFSLAGRTRAAAEAVAPYTAAPESRGGIDDDERIFNPAFFAHEPDLALLAVVHQLAALGTLAVMAGLASLRAASMLPPEPGVPVPLNLGDVFATVGALQWAGVAVLAIVGLERPGLWARRWRISGPAVAMGLAILASNAGWSGIVLVSRRVLSALGDAQLILGSEVALLEGFTAGVLAAAIAAAVIASLGLLRRPPQDPAAGEPVPSSLRALRSVIRGIDVIATVGVGIAFAVGFGLFLSRFQPPADWLAPWPVRIQGPDAGWITRVTAAVPLLLALAAGLAALATRSIPALRPWVASIWEVLTFWPRRFHPLAITPYSEIVVPKLQLEVVDGLKDGRRVVVSAHSQGSVLAVSALAGLSGGGLNLDGTSLVTHACPLGPLYGRFFPHQFAPQALVPLAEHLGTSSGVGSAWINAWRRGDPVGGPVANAPSNPQAVRPIKVGAPSGPVEMPLAGVGHAAAFDDIEVRRGIELLLLGTPAPAPGGILPRLGRIRFSPKPMVGWFDPSVLFSSGSRLSVTAAVRPFADRREVLAALDPAGGVIDLAEELRRPAPADGQPAQPARAGSATIGQPIAAAPVWVDYVADTGDGHVPTMAVAWHLARGLIRRERDERPEDQPADMTTAIDLAQRAEMTDAVGLTARPRPDGPDVALPRGSLLVIGGDLAYPIGTSSTYRDRLAGPYQQACDGLDAASGGVDPVVVAIPGNHDWYDGLDGFTGLMCDQGRLGAWRTVQRRSYVAVDIAPGWMLWAVDGGASGSDLDPTQLDYFTRIGSDLDDDVRVILAWPTPAWADGHRHAAAQVALDRFVLNTLGDSRRVALYLSGDSHHYAHLADHDSGVHYITAGGGGAFTHPTHQLRRRRQRSAGRWPLGVDRPITTESTQAEDVPVVNQPGTDAADSDTTTTEATLDTAFALTDATGRFGPRTLRLTSVFPSFGDSRKALLRHAWFPFTNPGFLAVTAAINAVFALIAVFTVSAERSMLDGLGELTGHLMAEYWASPLSWLPLAVVLLGATLFAQPEAADQASTFIARAAGLAHGIAQVIAIGFVLGFAAWVGERVGVLVGDRDPAELFGITLSAPSIVGAAVTLAIATGLGALVSAWVLAAYLVIANLGLGMHSNEVFSALRLTTHKHFLRIRVEPNGDLTVYPVGLAQTRRPLRWAAPEGGVGIDAHPAVFASDPRLIEAPFTISPLRTAASDPARRAPRPPDDPAAPGAEPRPPDQALPATDESSPLQPPVRQVPPTPPTLPPIDQLPSSGPSSSGDGPDLRR